MPIFDDALDVADRGFRSISDPPNGAAIRVQFVAAEDTSLPSTGRLPSNVLDRCRAAFVGTDAAVALGAPALRVRFVTPFASGSGPGRMPDTVNGVVRASFGASDTAIADFAPALRVQFV